MSDFDSENEVFKDIIKEALPNRMITHFVLIAEVLNSDTEELSIFTSESMTPWLALGMLKSASDMVQSNQGQPKFEDDEQ